MESSDWGCIAGLLVNKSIATLLKYFISFQSTHISLHRMAIVFKWNFYSCIVHICKWMKIFHIKVIYFIFQSSTICCPSCPETLYFCLFRCTRKPQTNPRHNTPMINTTSKITGLNFALAARGKMSNNEKLKHLFLSQTNDWLPPPGVPRGIMVG